MVLHHVPINVTLVELGTQKELSYMRPCLIRILKHHHCYWVVTKCVGKASITKNLTIHLFDIGAESYSMEVKRTNNVLNIRLQLRTFKKSLV